jgi:pimeloyl-ACP methyl ester carboxylesterase
MSPTRVIMAARVRPLLSSVRFSPTWCHLIAPRTQYGVVMTTFGLVHGAWHGAWCWDRLIPKLEHRGHRAIAVDLPASDPDAGYDAYAAAVMNAVDGVDGDDLVLVGHSLGGITIPVVASRRPVRHLVYLCALVPKPGESLGAVAGDAIVPGFGDSQVGHPDGSSSWDPDAAVEAFYHDCDPALARWAASQLRPQGWRIGNDPSPLEALPDAPSTYILCTEERAVRPDWSRRVAEAAGMRLIELPGSHSPFLSRPAELAKVLAAI